MWKFLLIFLLVSCHETYKSTGQTFTVSGKISSAKNNEGMINVSILYTKVAGTITNADGDFVIYGLRPGKYKIRLRALNYRNKDTIIIIKDSNIYNVNFKMKEVKFQ